jgi:hypothetical protein
MPQIAADLLEAGNDTPTLRRLAGEILSRQIARGVIAGIRNPRPAADTLEIAIW